MNGTYYDVLILGTGPAGLQAAIHAARKKVSVMVLGRQHKSSAYHAHIENYCCISGVTGEALLNEGRIQAKKSGAEFLDEDVLALHKLSVDPPHQRFGNQVGEKLWISDLLVYMLEKELFDSGLG